MDFDLGPRAEAFRAEISAFIAEHVTDELRARAWRTGTLHDWELHRAMAARNLIAPAWPEAMGGQGRDEYEMRAYYEEFARAGVPLDGLTTTMLVADTIRHTGTAEQQQRILPAVLAGEILICMGYTEPDCGSDVAAAKTRAVRQGDQWVINGQKMFTSLAHESAYVFLLTRTNPDVPKHRGLTMFLVPMDNPGVQVQPIETLGGQLVTVTFYSDVVVPDTARVGEVDGGWEVMTVGLALERTVTIGPGPMLAAVEAWASEPDDRGTRPLDRAAVREALVRTRIDAEIARLHSYRLAWTAAQGAVPVVEGSMAKLFGSEAYNRDAAALLDAIGPVALRTLGDPAGAAAGKLEHSYRYGPYYAIAGGASEIQRSIIAERGLGLPRSR